MNCDWCHSTEVSKDNNTPCLFDAGQLLDICVGYLSCVCVHCMENTFIANLPKNILFNIH